MYKPHFLFDLPDDNIKIWRYLDFEKFLSLVNSKSLYFCRSDKFEDPYEGTLSKDSLKQLSHFCEQFDNKDEMLAEFLLLFNATRKMTLVNCWHINNNESDGMWKLYSSSRNGIAIQSTVGRLKSSFNKASEQIFIGKVKYIDFDEKFVQAFNAMGPFIYKRTCFKHENELRAVLWNTGAIEESKDEKNIEFVNHGLSIDIDVNELIDKIIISPTSDGWFEELVKDILKKYKIDKSLIVSNLLSIPEYLKKSKHDYKEKLNIPSEILKNFIAKDSHRIKREEEELQRTIKLQSDSVLDKKTLIGSKIETVKYEKGANVLKGKEAINAFGEDFLNSKEIFTLTSKETFKTIYFVLGLFDNLIIELFDSVIPEREKGLLLKEILFVFSEKLAEGIIKIAVRLEKEETEVDAFKAIINTAHKFTEIMTKFRI